VTDDARPPLDTARLRRGLTAPWTAVEVVDATGSTNADLIDAPAGTVRAAEFQDAGRGRLDRSWTSPPRAGLIFSAVVAPPVTPSAWGWLPLLTGVAVCDAVRELTGLAVGLKWPNDVLVDERKLAGILVQASGPRAVIGVGLNVTTTAAELGLDTATSLALAGAGDVDRSQLLAEILVQLGNHYQQWTHASGDAAASGLADTYRSRCTTIGRSIIVTTGAGERPGTAVGVDDRGRLRVRWESADMDELTEQAIAAGDIVHVRVTKAC
jgi:BirA family biotin operon repressor/biotin-[acetyl-CoA-carboxylase] ligase